MMGLPVGGGPFLIPERSIEMAELVNVINNQVVTDSLMVAEVFEKEHKHVLEAIRQILVAENSAAKFFHESTYENRGKQYPCYLMNRDGFSLLVMGFTGSKALEWKLRYIEAFNAMEKALQEQARPSYQIADPIARAQAWIEEEKKRQLLAAENEEMKPKALFADAVSASHTSILIRDLAKLVKQNGVDIGQNRLFAWLRDNGYLIKSGSDKNMPTQKAMDMKLFEVKEGSYIDSKGANCITRTTKVTGKGQVYFVNKLLHA